MNTHIKFDASFLKIANIIIGKAKFENDLNIVSLDNERYSHNVTFGFTPGVNLDLNKMQLIFDCKIETIQDINTTIPISAEFQIIYYLDVDNLNHLVQIKDDGLNSIDETLIASVANIVYSTSRGIIFTRCQGTILKNFIMPVVSTTNLLSMLLPKNQNITHED